MANKKSGCYLETAIAALVVVVAVKIFWPSLIPFTMFEFWRLNGSLGEVLAASWPVFVWGSGVTLVNAVLTRNDPRTNRNAETGLQLGVLGSLIAGVFEEISFRWIIFYGQIVGYKLLNWLIFGWAGFGAVEWFYNHVSAPVVNFLTFGFLSEQLFSPLGWAVGAAMISANGKFRDGHAYLGLVGFVNAWFIGMFMFYLMFQYGLVACIIVHFLYDLFIYVIRYLDAVIERAIGWA